MFVRSQEEAILEFRLLYSGRVLASSNTKRRTDEKHAIRKLFHPQLRQLWFTNHNLKTFAVGMGGLKYEDEPTTHEERVKVEAAFLAGTARISNKWKFSNFSFLPLVTEGDAVRCSIDILFLRPEASGMLIKGGDIDGRIKTIFDALRMPQIGELDTDLTPEETESPFFVLLEDDKLISEVKVTTDELLLLPNEQTRLDNHAFMSLHVKLQITRETGLSWIF